MDKLAHKPDGDCHLYHCENRPNLVITVGDSWSYGDCLGDLGSHAYRPSQEWSQHSSLYRDARLTHCWGRHLADALSADWFECSSRGICNDTILIESEWWCSPDADEFLAQYDHVYLCVVLTEAGRADRYHTLTANPEEIFHTYDSRFSRGNGTPWLDVIADRAIAEQGWLSGVATHKLNQLYMQPTVSKSLQQSWKQHFVDHTNKVAPVWKHLRKHPLHYAGHTCHPRLQAHKMYADYVLANAGW